MAFTGKATYSAGSTMPEIAEDVGDIIGIVSPFETPLLDHLGDPRREARSTVHEWLEDKLLPNTDTIDDASIAAPTTETSFDVANPSRFEVGDLVRPDGSGEVMLVLSKAGSTLVVVRGYGGTTSEAISNGQDLHILGNAALEGDTRPAASATNRVRKANYTQIFTSGIEVSGSQQAVRTLGIEDELDYQKQERIRELLRDLENCVINGVSSTTNPEGSSTIRRSMNGIVSMVQTNVFEPGVGDMPDGGGSGSDELTEELLNAALREIWERSSGTVDTIVLNGVQKRRVNAFAGGARTYGNTETYKDLISVYESDFGVARVLLSRWVPKDSILLLDSSRIEVMPLNGRSFHYKPLASSGDSEVGQVIGEYTMEMRNENAHGVLMGLSAA